MVMDSHYIRWIEQEYSRLARQGEPFAKLATRLFRRGPVAGQKMVARLYRAVATAFFVGSLAVWYAVSSFSPPVATVVFGLVWVVFLCYMLCTHSENVSNLSQWLRSRSAEPITEYYLDQLLLHLKKEPQLQQIVVNILKKHGASELTDCQGQRLMESARNIEHWREMEKRRRDGLEKLETLGLVSKAQNQQRAQTLHEHLPPPQEPQTRNRF